MASDEQRQCTTDGAAHTRGEIAALGAILLVALGLRLFELTGQSLWYDEGVSAYMTPRTFAEIADGDLGRHSPAALLLAADGLVDGVRAGRGRAAGLLGACWAR